MTRKDFLKFLAFFSISLVSGNFLNTYFGDDLTKEIDFKLRKKIRTFNSSRKYLLKHSLNGEIFKDHNSNKTIWIKRDLYTYAELHNLLSKDSFIN